MRRVLFLNLELLPLASSRPLIVGRVRRSSLSLAYIANCCFNPPTPCLTLGLFMMAGRICRPLTSPLALLAKH